MPTWTSLCDHVGRVIVYCTTVLLHIKMRASERCCEAYRASLKVKISTSPRLMSGATGEKIRNK